MSSNKNPPSTNISTDMQWVVEIRESLKALSVTELDLKNPCPVCICEVPDSLSSSKPEAFIPQFVGLGPYHHSRDQLIMTKEKKLGAAKRVLKDLHQVLDNMNPEIGSELLIFYHPDVNSTYKNNHYALSRLLTVDGMFLLAFITLLTSPNPDVGFSFFLTGNLGVPVFNAAGKELTKNALVRDVFKLENQIPFRVLEDISLVNVKEIQSAKEDDKGLSSNLETFCKQHCPFVNSEELPKNQDYHHLLDLMYQLIVPNQQTERKDESGASENQPPEQNTVPEGSVTQPPEQNTVPEGSVTQPPEQNTGAPPKDKTSCLFTCCIFVFVLGIIVYLMYLLVKWVLSLLCRICRWVLEVLHGALSESENSSCDNPFLTALKGVVERLLNIAKMVESKDSEEGVRVMIRSVTELHQVGISFKAAERGIKSIKFDEEKCVFFLPCVRIDANSEVIIRNLVAYETLTKSSDPLSFTRYVELMRAIIDTPEDVKLLVENNIVKTEFKDRVVADLFNGMSKSIRDTKDDELNKVIDKVNAKYDSNRKRDKAVNKYTSAKFLTTIGGLIFLVFTAAQTYCTFYGCSARSGGASKFDKLPETGDYGRNNYFISSM